MKLVSLGLLVALLGSAHPGLARDVAQPGQETQLEASARKPAEIVDAFHAALAQGDTAAALALLAEDAVIYESGGVERGKAEYAALHLETDAAFSKAVPSRITRRSGAADGVIAWILTEGRSIGTFRDRPVDRVATETAMLRRVAGVWRIAHFHWSSAAAKPAN